MDSFGSGSTGKGTYRYDGRQLKRYPDGPEALAGTMTSSILEDRDGDIWFNPDRKDGIAGNDIWNLGLASGGRLWICHAEGQVGLELFDPESGTFEHFSYDAGDSGTISSNGVQGVYEDPDSGEVLVFHFGGEIDKSLPENKRITEWRNVAGDSGSLGDNIVNQILEDSDRQIWVGTARGGLDKLDRKTKRFTHFRSDPEDNGSIHDNNITALFEGSSGILWIGYWGGVISKFHRGEERCLEHYIPDEGDPDGIFSSQRIKYMIEDAEDTNVMWIATIEGGLQSFDKTTERFRNFRAALDAESLSSDTLPCL
jgi:ligand-binding sensor domain-containing protein